MRCLDSEAHHTRCPEGIHGRRSAIGPGVNHRSARCRLRSPFGLAVHPDSLTIEAVVAARALVTATLGVNTLERLVEGIGELAQRPRCSGGRSSRQVQVSSSYSYAAWQDLDTGNVVAVFR